MLNISFCCQFAHKIGFDKQPSLDVLKERWCERNITNIKSNYFICEETPFMICGCFFVSERGLCPKADVWGGDEGRLCD